MTPDEFLRFSRSLPEPTLLLFADGRVLAANPPASILLGVDARPQDDTRLSDFVTESAGEVARYLGQCSRTRERVLGSLTISSGDAASTPYRAEGAMLAPRSEITPAAILLRLVSRAAATNRFTLLNQQIEALNYQVRQRLLSERELSAERERLRITLESIGDAVIATDAVGRVTFMNPVAAALTGWDDGAARGRPLEEVFRIVNEYTRLQVDTPVSRVLRDGVVVGLANHTSLIARDGVERPIEDSGAPIRDSDGEIVGVVLVFRDVSERRLAERERDQVYERERRARALAEEASRAKDEFLAMVSHELRTPLNTMLGWVRLIRAGQLSPETYERGIESIERSVLSQGRLIDDLLDISRIVTGQLRLSVQTVNLEELVDAAIDAVRPTANAKAIRLDAVLDGAAGKVSVDPDRLRQVIWNLLSNAIKFTPKGGEVQVRLSPVDSHVELHVRDTGQGIDPEFLPFVFDRFRQADASITRQLGGLGLGLAIVKQIVEAHGGTVRAESEGAGKGSTFSVRLPVAPLITRPQDVPQPAPEELARVAESTSDLEGVRILLVDDEPDAREILTLHLEARSAVVRSAGSAAEALETFATWPTDVLISDIGMPGEDGYALISKIRELGLDSGGAVPAIALTAYARTEDRIMALQSGFQMQVTKPVEPSELVMVIQSLLGLIGRN